MNDGFSINYVRLRKSQGFPASTAMQVGRGVEGVAIPYPRGTGREVGGTHASLATEVSRTAVPSRYLKLGGLLDLWYIYAFHTRQPL